MLADDELLLDNRSLVDHGLLSRDGHTNFLRRYLNVPRGITRHRATTDLDLFPAQRDRFTHAFGFDPFLDLHVAGFYLSPSNAQLLSRSRHSDLIVAPRLRLCAREVPHVGDVGVQYNRTLPFMEPRALNRHTDRAIRLRTTHVGVDFDREIANLHRHRVREKIVDLTNLAVIR